VGGKREKIGLVLVVKGKVETKEGAFCSLPDLERKKGGGKFYIRGRGEGMPYLSRGQIRQRRKRAPKDALKGVRRSLGVGEAVPPSPLFSGENHIPEKKVPDWTICPPRGREEVDNETPIQEVH